MGRIALVPVLLAACATPSGQLEHVAKDWCLTIRASQVLPVYPPSEDVEPGDVFLVDTSLADQARVYEEKGFLPLDQLVTRLRGLPYDAFYRDGYFENPFGNVPHERPSAGTSPSAPKVAFPAYSFQVDRSQGLKLALPLSGVPVGLGLLGSSQARGSVTIRDASTYAIDGETLARKLYAWWNADEDVRDTFGAIARDTGRPVYLRAVTRVFLARGVTVSLVSLDSAGAGVDAGVPPQVELQKLAMEQPDLAPKAAAAYRDALATIGGPPGGSVRLVQASTRAVTLDEDFERPLVLGYLGFDVRIFPDGTISAPVPSFATVAGGSTALENVKAMSFGEDSNTALLERFLEDPANYEKLTAWLAETGRDINPSDLLHGAAYSRERADAVAHFGLR
ncbi:MAG TPA: hypothetical protein VFY93_15100 [Planctomycetota bacterium]|nr:hypothetical protein [Planctomycetota bacterium]